MSMLEQWVGDQLHDILGISDKYIAQYFMALASKASSSDDFVQKLKDTGTVDVDNTLTGFARQLYDKVPPKASQEKPQRAAERAAVALQAKNTSYQLLADSDDDVKPSVSKPKKVKKDKSGGKNKRQLRKRASSESSESEDEKPAIKRPRSDSEDDFDQQERERMKDLDDRDAFADRLKSKDKEKTRTIMSKSEKKAHEEAVKRLHMESLDRKKLVPELRKESRRKYLGKREVDKLDDLAQEIQEEEYYFGDQK